MLKDHDAQLLHIKLKLAALGLLSTYHHSSDGPLVRTFFFKPSPSIILSKFTSRSEDLSMAVGLEGSSILLSRDGEYLSIQIPHSLEDRKLVFINDCLGNLAAKKSEYILPLMLGQTPQGEYHIEELHTAPHTLVCGQTGSGKSILLSAILLGLSAHCGNMLDIRLVDIKRVDYAPLAHLPQISEICTSAQMFHEMFHDLRKTINKRFDILARAKMRNIVEYNSSYPEKGMGFIIVLIDELAALMDNDAADKRGTKKADWDYPLVEDVIRDLAQISRAAGVHIIASTQRASVDILSGTIKSNLPMRICMKVPAEIDSRVVLGVGGAEHLLGRGDMLICSSDSTIRRIHAPFVPPRSLEAFVEYLEYRKGE